MSSKDLIRKRHRCPIRIPGQHKQKMLIKPFVFRNQLLLLDYDVRINVVDHNLMRVDSRLSSFHGNIGCKIQ